MKNCLTHGVKTRISSFSIYKKCTRKYSFPWVVMNIKAKMKIQNIFRYGAQYKYIIFTGNIINYTKISNELILFVFRVLCPLVRKYIPQYFLPISLSSTNLMEFTILQNKQIIPPSSKRANLVISLANLHVGLLTIISCFLIL